MKVEQEEERREEVQWSRRDPGEEEEQEEWREEVQCNNTLKLGKFYEFKSLTYYFFFYVFFLQSNQLHYTVVPD